MVGQSICRMKYNSACQNIIKLVSFFFQIPMSAVDRARLLYYQNSPYSFQNLNIYDTPEALRTQSLDSLEQITNLCQKIKLTPFTYQQSPLHLKLKFLQAYQYSYLYSINLKNMCQQKQAEIYALNSQLKQQIETKRNTIKEHKQKVQKRKHQYRQLKVNSAKLVCKNFQQQMQTLKNKQNQLHQIKLKLQQEIHFGRNQLLQNKYHSTQEPQSDMINYANPQPDNPFNALNQMQMQQNYQNNGSNFDYDLNLRRLGENLHKKMNSNPKLPNTSQKSINSHQRPNSNQKSLSEMLIEQQNKRQQHEAKKSSKRNSMQSSNNQRHSEVLIDEYEKKEKNDAMKSIEKKSTKNMVQSKVSIKFMETQIGDKDDLIFKESLKPLSKISKNSQKATQKSYPGLRINQESVDEYSPTTKVPVTDAFNYLQEENDTVHELDDFNLPPESKRQKSPTNKSGFNSQVSKGGSNSFIESDDSFYNKKFPIDSNLTRNELLQSKSGIFSNQTESMAGLFNPNKIKRKSADYDSIQIKPTIEQQNPTAQNQDSIELSNSKQMPDRDLWTSKNGVNGIDEQNLKNLFNSPKKKQSQSLNQSYSSLNDQNVVSSPRKSDKFNDNDDLDDLELGFSTNESKIQKKGKNQPKVELKATSSKLYDVAQESESQITTKQNTKIILPPSISKTQEQSDYEDDFENQNEDQNKSKINIQTPNSEKETANIMKSQIQINVSPNNSFTELVKEEKIFHDLISEKFQLTHHQKQQQHNLFPQKGIFVSYSNQSKQEETQSIGMNQSNASSNFNKKVEPVTIQTDFMDFEISIQSNIGKRPAGLKKTSKLSSQKDIKPSYSINLINNQKEVTFQESINQSQNDGDDLLLELGGDLLSTKVIQKGQNKKPQTMNLIESTTFDEEKNPKNQTESKKIIDSVNLVQLNNNPVLESKQSLLGSQSSQNLKPQSLKLLQLNNPVLQSRENDRIPEEEVEEDINFDLEEDNSKLMQSEKQQIERKLVKIMRNKHKQADKPNLNIKNVDKQIQNQIKLLMPQKNAKSQQNDWKQIRKTFEAKIRQITKDQKGNSKQIQHKVTQIEDRNAKLLEQQKLSRQKLQKQKLSKPTNQDEEDSISELNYSQSLIKDSFKKSIASKKNIKMSQIQTDSQVQNQSNRMTNSSFLEDDAMTMSLKEKSMFFGQKNVSQLPQIMQNNSFEADSIYNKSNLKQTDEFMILELNEKSKFIRKQDEMKNQENTVNRTNHLIGSKGDLNTNGSKDEKRPNEISKSKYVKATTPTVKSVPKESAVSRLQQNKYVTMEDPLNNQISTNKSMAKKTIQDDQDGF